MDFNYTLLTNQQLLSFIQRYLELTYPNERDRQRARDMVIELRRRHARRKEDKRVDDV